MTLGASTPPPQPGRSTPTPPEPICSGTTHEGTPVSQNHSQVTTHPAKPDVPEISAAESSGEGCSHTREVNGVGVANKPPQFLLPAPDYCRFNAGKAPNSHCATGQRVPNSIRLLRNRTAHGNLMLFRKCSFIPLSISKMYQQITQPSSGPTPFLCKAVTHP